MRVATVVFSINRSFGGRTQCYVNTCCVEGRPCINGSDLGIRPSSLPILPVPCVRDGIQAKSGSSFGGSRPFRRWCHDEERPSIRRYVRRCQPCPASLSRPPPPHPSAVPANPRQYTASMHHCIPQEPRQTPHKERDRAARKWISIFP